VFVYLDQTLQLGVDCAAMLSPRRGVAYGWAMTPREGGTELSVSAGVPGDCQIEHCSFHPRPDVVASDPRRAVVNGFTLVFETPEEPEELVLTLATAAGLLRADLRDPRTEANLFKATADRAWRVTFGLLREAATTPVLAELLRYQGRPFGAFADWMARLPLLRGRAENLGGIAEAEALAAPSGEVLVMLRAAAAMPPEAELSAAVIGWLRDAADGLPEPVPLGFVDWHAARLPAALAGYGRLDPALLDRLQALEVIVHAVRRDGDESWLRCQPAGVTVPELLDATCRSAAAALTLPVEAAASAGLDLLRQVIARREAAFGPALGALVGAEAAEAGRLPRLALILGADDPAVVRLFHVTVEEFERRCDTLLVMGSVADDVAQCFARRGRLRVLVGVEAAQALREAAGRAGILAVDAAAFAAAVIAGRPAVAFSRPLEAAEVARLLALHGIAGCTGSLTDSLQRLLRLRRAAPGEAPFAPVQRAWTNRHAAEQVNAHLQRLWTAAGPARRPAAEPLPHG
jgi:hypothetical protein